MRNIGNSYCIADFFAVVQLTSRVVKKMCALNTTITAGAYNKGSRVD